MSVHRVEVLSHGPDHLRKVLDLILTSPQEKLGTAQHPIRDNTVNAWRVEDGVLFFDSPYSASDKWTKFPSSMNAAMLVPIIEAWLKDQKYPPEPPFDGHSTRGFLIKSCVGYDGDLSVQPDWVHYGK